MQETNNGQKGGTLKGDKHSAPSGGISAIVVTDNNKPVKLEDGEAIIKASAVKKHWKQLSLINESEGGNPISKPVGGVAKNGGMIQNEYDKLRFVAESVLKSQLPKGLYFTYSGFSDTNGKSMYFSVYKIGEDLKGIKTRFSDHPVQNIDRLSNEAHFSFKEELQEQSINKIGYLLGLDGYKYEQIDLKRKVEVSENNIRGRKVLKEYISKQIEGSKIKPSKKYLVEDTVKGVYQYTSDNKFEKGGLINKQAYIGEIGGNTGGLGSPDINKGWFKNPHDNKWRFEISDKDLIVAPLVVGVYKLSDIVSHPSLFKYYPEFSNIHFEVINDKNIDSPAHVYTFEKTIKFIYNIYGEQRIIKNNIRFDAPALRKNIFAHELQHLIQIREGMGGGSSTIEQFAKILKEQGLDERTITKDQRDFFTGEAYKFNKNSSGEIEAMDVANRVEMSDEQRKEIEPLSSVIVDKDYLNVDLEENIFEMGGNITDNKNKMENKITQTMANFKETLLPYETGDIEYNPFQIPIYIKSGTDNIFVFKNDIRPVWIQQNKDRNKLNKLIENKKIELEKLENKKHTKNTALWIERANEKDKIKRELDNLIKKSESTPITVGQIAPRAISLVYNEDGESQLISEYQSELMADNYKDMYELNNTTYSAPIYKKGDKVFMFSDEPTLTVTEVNEWSDKLPTYDLRSEDGSIIRNNISENKLTAASDAFSEALIKHDKMVAVAKKEERLMNIGEENIYEASKYLRELISEQVAIYELDKKNKYAKDEIGRLLGIYFNEIVSKNPNLLFDFLKDQINLPNTLRVMAQYAVEPDFSETFKANLKSNIWDLIPEELKEYKLPKKLNYLPEHDDKNLANILAPFTSDDTLRLNLMGVRFDKDGILATDAHKMLFLYHPDENREPKTFCMDKDCLKENEIATNDKKRENIDELRYPNYKVVVPDNKNSVSIHTESLIAYLSTVIKSKYFNPVIRQCFIKFDSEQEFAFNTMFLLAGAEAMYKLGYEQIDISYSTPNRAIVITEKGKRRDANNFKTDFVLVMPVMMSFGDIVYLSDGTMFFNAESECVQTKGVESKSCVNPITVHHNKINAKLKKIDEFEAKEKEKEAKRLADEAAEKKRLEEEEQKRLAEIVIEEPEILTPVDVVEEEPVVIVDEKEEWKEALTTLQMLLREEPKNEEWGDAVDTLYMLLGDEISDYDKAYEKNYAKLLSQKLSPKDFNKKLDAWVKKNVPKVTEKQVTKKMAEGGNVPFDDDKYSALQYKYNELYEKNQSDPELKSVEQEIHKMDGRYNETLLSKIDSEIAKHRADPNYDEYGENINKIYALFEQEYFPLDDNEYILKATPLETLEYLKKEILGVTDQEIMESQFGK